MTDDRPLVSKTTNVLALALYCLGEVTETRLAEKLGTDRLDARRRASEFLNTCLANAGVPVERITILEGRLSVSLAQVARLQLEIHELRQDLAAERGHVIELLHVADYAHRLAECLLVQVGDPAEDGCLSTAELHTMAAAVLGQKGGNHH